MAVSVLRKIQLGVGVVANLTARAGVETASSADLGGCGSGECVRTLAAMNAELRVIH